MEGQENIYQANDNPQNEYDENREEEIERSSRKIHKRKKIDPSTIKKSRWEVSKNGSENKPNLEQLMKG
jgi:hypothetical protein